MMFQVLQGDARRLPFDDETFDSCVTDPPYELTSARPGGRSEATCGKVMGGFMGLKWDGTGVAFDPATWREAFRVLKPGAYLLAFGGTRTYHRMACAIEDAGFEIRDQLQWIYGSGFPKSLDVSKAIDKMNGDVRPVIGKQRTNVGMQGNNFKSGSRSGDVDITSAASAASAAWEGWGTALKPANEPICLARKPLEKGLTVAQNVLKWGTGALNIDACRIPVTDDEYSRNCPGDRGHDDNRTRSLAFGMTSGKSSDIGRFPANVIHDGSEEVLAGFPHTASGKKESHHARNYPTTEHIYGKYSTDSLVSYADEGSAARFFYCAKASQSERNRNTQNHHPTVKPINLMAYLCRLVTPPKGLVLDPFNGSGSTGLAAVQEGFRYIGLELELEYIEISKRRLAGMQIGLF